MTWVKDRLKEYHRGKRRLERYREMLKRPQHTPTAAEQAEIDIVSSMISSMAYAIEWMRTGRRPHSRRGVEIRDAYTRAVLMDMDLLPAEVPPEQEMRITEQQKRELAKILLRLSERELQCFLMHAVDGLSYAEIAKEMKLTKRSVQEYIARAKAKVGQGI
jgi:RNA polymerase sigma-70 factor (ECF subfamily)